MNGHETPLAFSKNWGINQAMLTKDQVKQRKAQEKRILELIAAVGETESTEALKQEISQCAADGPLKIPASIIDRLKAEQGECLFQAQESRKGVLGGLITRIYVMPFEKKSENIGLLINYLLSLNIKINKQAE